MSFSFEFHAAPADVSKILDSNFQGASSAPECVKEFVRLAVKDLPATASVVFVKAAGHLFDGRSYDMSTCEIKVQPINVKS